MKKLLAAWLCLLALFSASALCESGAGMAGEVFVGLAEEAVSVGEPALPGTLTYPDGSSPVSLPLPAAVLLHGSGPSDRDESVGQIKMFRDLARMLAMQGIAVLRYDKRTYVYGSTYTREDLAAFTVREETMDDAVAAAQWLRNNPRIDPNRIYLIGHSMGAMLAPRIARENPGLFAGLVMLSGTPKTLADIVLSQNQAVVDALPALSRAIGTFQMQGLRSEWKSILDGTGEEAKQKTVFGQPAYYFWEMAQYDTGEILKELRIPALIINGGQDIQVVNADGAEAWNSISLPDGVRLIWHPELNHFLMNPDAPEGVKGTVKEYDVPCHVPADIINEITQFIFD